MLRFALIIALLASASALAAPPQVHVKTLQGQTTTGRLAALTANEITLQSSAGEKTIPSQDILWIDLPASQPVTEKPAVWLDLVDGGALTALAYSSASGTARIELTSAITVEMPTRAIRAVRFRQQTSAALAGQWREISRATATGDTVVIRKSAARAADPDANQPAANPEPSLDQLEGTVLAVGPDSVQFEFENEKINVRRDKLEGLIYFQPVKRDFAQPLCRLIDTGGSTWLVREFNLTGDNLSVTTLGGVTFPAPLTAVARLDFSAGNILFLSSLEPDSGGDEPVISLQPAGMANKFGRLFHLRAAPPLGADAFRLAGTRYDSGLSLHSPLTLVYRVPEGFRWFRAIAGVDDSIVTPGNFTLVIKGDGQELLRHDFSSDSSATRSPLPLDLDVSKVRRLTILLDPADGQDIGDQLNLCEARFTK